MPVHRSVSAWIEVDEEPLEEYAGEQDPEDERTYACWVECLERKVHDQATSSSSFYSLSPNILHFR